MRVAVLSAGFESRSLRLQPHRSLLEMGRQLADRGHQSVLISNGAERMPAQDEIMGLPVYRLTSVNLFRRRGNPALLDLLERVRPDVVLWHLSLSSFLHQEMHHPFAERTLGIITSPVYRARDVIRLGITKLSTNPEMVATHLTGTLVPGALYGAALGPGGLRGLITLSETTRQHLIARGAPGNRVWAVPPGVDAAWLETCVSEADQLKLRTQLGYRPEDFVVIYFGSPAPVRGLHTTLMAVERVARNRPNVRMVILSRRHSDEWQKTAAQLERLIDRDGLRGRVQIVDGYLSQEDLIRYISSSDLVCLPFELVPSDVPLSILEAMALSQPVIGTRIACIPEMLGHGRGFLVPPGSVSELSGQIQAIVDSPELSQQRGRRARAYVDRMGTWADMGGTLEQVLNKAAAIRSGVPVSHRQARQEADADENT